MPFFVTAETHSKNKTLKVKKIVQAAIGTVSRKLICIYKDEKVILKHLFVSQLDVLASG